MGLSLLFNRSAQYVFAVIHMEIIKPAHGDTWNIMHFGTKLFGRSFVWREEENMVHTLNTPIHF